MFFRQNWRKISEYSFIVICLLLGSFIGLAIGVYSWTYLYIGNVELRESPTKRVEQIDKFRELKDKTYMIYKNLDASKISEKKLEKFSNLSKEFIKKFPNQPEAVHLRIRYFILKTEKLRQKGENKKARVIAKHGWEFIEKLPDSIRRDSIVEIDINNYKLLTGLKFDRNVNISHKS